MPALPMSNAPKIFVPHQVKTALKGVLAFAADEIAQAARYEVENYNAVHETADLRMRTQERAIELMDRVASGDVTVANERPRPPIQIERVTIAQLSDLNGALATSVSRSLKTVFGKEPSKQAVRAGVKRLVEQLKPDVTGIVEKLWPEQTSGTAPQPAKPTAASYGK